MHAGLIAHQTDPRRRDVWITKPTTFRSLVDGFVESVDRFPSRPALVVDGKCFTYLALKRMAARIGSAIRQHVENLFPLVALLAYRRTTAYVGILCILATGKGYFRLN